MIEALTAKPWNPYILSGKWLIKVNKKEADDVWNDLSANIESGKFHHRAKISTAKTNYFLRDVGKGKRLICFYTPNFLWRGDVRRARIELRRFGFRAKLHYRPDILTILETYSVASSPFERNIFRTLRKNGVSKLETRHRYYG